MAGPHRRKAVTGARASASNSASSSRILCTSKAVGADEQGLAQVGLPLLEPCLDVSDQPVETRDLRGQSMPDPALTSTGTMARVNN
jgi:hypothetical protein